MGTNTISTDSRRQYFLDNLKLLLTVLVVFHHAAQAHNEGAYWPYSFEDTSMLIPWIWKFLSTNASFFMGLFFLIAGYFVPISYDRQNAGVFVNMDNLLRELTAHNLQNRTVALIDNGTWAPLAGKQMAEEIAKWKNCTLLEPMLSLKSALKAEQLSALDALANALTATLK